MSDKPVCMATTMEVRLAPANARDGVDTRPEGEKDLTACLEVRSQDRDAQTAAIRYLLPPGAEVPRSNMSAFWTNYLRTAENYVKGDPLGHFIFTSYRDQQGQNEGDIERECRKLGAGEEMLHVYRQCYNAAVTEYLSEPSEFNLGYVRKYLGEYNAELAAQTKAAVVIQRAFRATLPAKCAKCDERRMGDFTELCADCYWTEDANIKRECRERRRLQDVVVGMVLTPYPEIDVAALVDMTGVPEWEAFWAKFQAKPQLRIRKPKPKYPCFRGCGAESTTRVRGRNMCEPCADLAQNVGECVECGAWGPRREKDVICADCYDDFLCYLAENEDRARYDLDFSY